MQVFFQPKSRAKKNKNKNNKDWTKKVKLCTQVKVAIME